MTIVAQKAEKVYTVQSQAENKEVSRSLILSRRWLTQPNSSWPLHFNLKVKNGVPAQAVRQEVAIFTLRCHGPWAAGGN